MIYLRHCNDSLSISNNFLVAQIPDHIGISSLGVDIELYRVLLYTVDRLQLGGEGVRIRVNLSDNNQNNFQSRHQQTWNQQSV